MPELRSPRRALDAAEANAAQSEGAGAEVDGVVAELIMTSFRRAERTCGDGRTGAARVSRPSPTGIAAPREVWATA